MGTSSSAIVILWCLCQYLILPPLWALHVKIAPGDHLGGLSLAHQLEMYLTPLPLPTHRGGIQSRGRVQNFISRTPDSSTHPFPTLLLKKSVTRCRTASSGQQLKRSAQSKVLMFQLSRATIMKRKAHHLVNINSPLCTRQFAINKHMQKT